MTDTDNPTIDLIILGNGFDLAHDMKTAYSDYISAMILDALRGDPQYGSKSPFYIGNSVALYLDDNDSNKIPNKDLVELYQYIAEKLQHTLSHLTESLLKDIETKGWADLEQSYFDVLCQYYKDKDAIKQLNEDMDLLQKSLHTYLKEIKPTHKSLSISEHITNIRDTEKRRLEALKTTTMSKREELNSKLDKITAGRVEQNYEKIRLTGKIVRLNNEIESIEREIKDLQSRTFVVLNFNYTDTIGLYFKENEYIHIPIHNTLADDEIVLGYGDETSEMYKTLENANDNELLKYFKSFYYMQNSRYRDLERIISSDKFRIHIMGHSCGLSDKVLLSHLFNHENLDTIRIYYYDKGEGKNDFFEKCQNISRLAIDKHRIRCKILPPSQEPLNMDTSVPLIPFSEQDIENSDRWEALF